MLSRSSNIVGEIHSVVISGAMVLQDMREVPSQRSAF